MASTSDTHSNDVSGKLRTAAVSVCSENQSLITEIRKAVTVMKDIAVDLEKDKKSNLVKKLEAGVIQLLEASDDCTFLSNAVQSVGVSYQPGPEPTNFKKILDAEIAKSKAISSSTSQKAQMLRQFREAIWNVHHSGQPMPGDENEDIFMTSTDSNVRNTKCPVTGKRVTDLEEPVRSVDCKHIYEKKAIMHYMASKHHQCPCPVAACPKVINREKVMCDPLLLVDIEEHRKTTNSESGRPVVEDFTGLDDEEED